MLLVRSFLWWSVGVTSFDPFFYFEGFWFGFFYLGWGCWFYLKGIVFFIVFATMGCMEFGKFGVWWVLFGSESAVSERDVVREIERFGYLIFWFGESFCNKDVFVHVGILFVVMECINVVIGIVGIYNCDVIATKFGAAFFVDVFGGCFVFGFGVSYVGVVIGRGYDYGKLVSIMCVYFDVMDVVLYVLFVLNEFVLVLFVVLCLCMFELVVERTAGAHLYLTMFNHIVRVCVMFGDGLFFVFE